ncbi:hypothetical protein GCM10010344_03840 [Streptomyces bluensis]|nr:hypothetical protein GCM10010344_03840 [Streptomyces bluensis]
METRDTVCEETPASRATSAMEAVWDLAPARGRLRPPPETFAGVLSAVSIPRPPPLLRSLRHGFAKGPLTVVIGAV